MVLEDLPRTSAWLPNVSVIVPTYNRPQMMTEALHSILTQTYKNFEIVVVNDGGADVERMLTAFGRQRPLTYIRHATNRGLAAARNTGLKVARGKYIAYLDDDDVFFPTHLETLVQFLEKSEFKIAYTDAYRAHQTKTNENYIVTKRDIPHSYDFDEDLILIHNLAPVLCFMHERSCIEKVGNFDETLTTHEDWDLWIRMSRCFKMAHIKRVTCEYRWREDGSTMSSSMPHDFLRTSGLLYDRYRSYSGMPRIIRWFPEGAVAGALRFFTYYRLCSNRHGYFRAVHRVLEVWRMEHETPRT